MSQQHLAGTRELAVLGPILSETPLHRCSCPTADPGPDAEPSHLSCLVRRSLGSGDLDSGLTSRGRKWGVDLGAAVAALCESRWVLEQQWKHRKKSDETMEMEAGDGVGEDARCCSSVGVYILQSDSYSSDSKVPALSAAEEEEEEELPDSDQANIYIIHPGGCFLVSGIGISTSRLIY
ncbi:hypothetical protein LINGRAHAP2_LOCUS2823 [Linum grandiflorum]